VNRKKLDKCDESNPAQAWLRGLLLETRQRA
jgi:hypothetical protein